MNKLDLTVILALMSVTLGWFLNELSQWFRSRQSDKKIKKQILFNLLETNHIFKRLDTAEFKKVYTERILIRIPENEQTDDLKFGLDQVFSMLITGIFQDDVSDSLKNIEIKYSTAVENLASLDPITAFHLNGKTKIMDTFNQIQTYFDEIKEILPGDNEDIQNHINSVFHSSLKPDMIKGAISDLESEILKIAISIDLWTWLKLKRSFVSSVEKDRKNMELKIDELLDRAIPKTI